MLRVALPVVLVFADVTLLIGCIYVPATRAFQRNDHLRPEHLVGGMRSSKPVRIGVTPIEEALLPLLRQVEPKAGLPRHLDTSGGIWAHKTARRIAIRYEISTGTFLSICGIYGDSEGRMLTLDLDERGVVTAAEAIDPRDAGPADTFSPMTPDDVTRLFSPATIRRLQSAGWLMSDVERQQYQQRMEQREKMRAEVARQWRERMARLNASTTRATTAPAAMEP